MAQQSRLPGQRSESGDTRRSGCPSSDGVSPPERLGSSNRQARAVNTASTVSERGSMPNLEGESPSPTLHRARLNHRAAVAATAIGSARSMGGRTEMPRLGRLSPSELARVGSSVTAPSDSTSPVNGHVTSSRTRVPVRGPVRNLFHNSIFR